MTYYISPSFLNKLAVHITKNYLDLPQVKVPLILGVHGRKGEGKTFQCELVFEQMGVEVVYISGGELESPDAGDPARLIRLRYREAAELVRVRGRMAVLMINDLDAGAGRFDRMTQYTVNTQLVNNTLMNIADNPTNVQLPGSYDEKALPRIPIIATGNDFATLYAPLIRDGRMQKFYWEPSHADRLGIVGGMFAGDGLASEDIETLVNRFKDQAIDFFGAVRSQLYDEQITQFIHSVGIDKIASNVVNSLKLPSFTRPSFQLDHLIAIGETLVYEQSRVRTMGLVSEYNQAVTPTGSNLHQVGHQVGHQAVHRQTAPSTYRRDTALLTPPEASFLKPYGLGKRDAQLANGSKSSMPTAAQQPSENPQLHSILAQGNRLGIEHVDQRRFRVNSWQSYGTFDPSHTAEADSQLQACRTQFPNHYIRLISIDPQTNRRLNETVIQRPEAP